MGPKQTQRSYVMTGREHRGPDGIVNVGDCAPYSANTSVIPTVGIYPHYEEPIDGTD